MKLAVLGESPADESAVRTLVDALLGEPTEAVDLPLRARGWPSPLYLLPSVIKKLHYHTDADALVTIVDSDRSTLHLLEHEELGKAEDTCRLCQLRRAWVRTVTQLRPVQHRRPLKFAAGLAVPSVEAWYRHGHDPHVGEATWRVALDTKKFPYDVRRLKAAVYGDFYTLEHETRRAVEEARRLSKTLESLKESFPHGFGALARDVRSWQTG